MKLILMLLSLVMFGLLVACTPEATPEPTPTTGPSLAAVLSEELDATSTKEPTIAPSLTPKPTIAPSLTPKPTSTTIPPTPTEITEVATEEPTKITQQSRQTDAATEVPVENVALRIVPDSINLRRGPGVIYRVVGFLFAGDEVTVLAKDRTGTWYNVLGPDDVSGWVAASVTEFTSDEVVLDSIEVAATIPVPPTLTPTPTSTPTPTPLPPPPQSSSDDDDDDDDKSSGNDDPPPDDDPPDDPPDNPYP